MTNNPTIDGVSREDERHVSVKALHDVMAGVPSSSLYSLAEAVLDTGYAPPCKTCGGSKTVFQLGFMSLDDGNEEPCPDCNAPVVERQLFAFDPIMIGFGQDGVTEVDRLQATCEGLDSQNDALAEEVAALQSTIAQLQARIAELELDRDRLDALDSNCWDVRFGSTPNGDAGDSSINIEIVGHWMDKPFERVIGENYSENLRAAIDQAMTAPAYPPERPEYPEFEDCLVATAALNGVQR